MQPSESFAVGRYPFRTDYPTAAGTDTDLSRPSLPAASRQSFKSRTPGVVHAVSSKAEEIGALLSPDPPCVRIATGCLDEHARPVHFIIMYFAVISEEIITRVGRKVSVVKLLLTNDTIVNVFLRF